MSPIPYLTLLLLLPLTTPQTITLTPLSHDGTKCPPSSTLLTTTLNLTAPFPLTHTLPSFNPPITTTTRSNCTALLSLSVPPTSRILINTLGMSVTGYTSLAPGQQLSFRARYNWTDTQQQISITNEFIWKGPLEGRFERRFGMDPEEWVARSGCGGGTLRVGYEGRGFGKGKMGREEEGGREEEEGEEWVFGNSLEVVDC